ncbi:MAG: hypothetical protein ABMA01_05590 [Chthoniobacteraceae bacterium]
MKIPFTSFFATILLSFAATGQPPADPLTALVAQNTAAVEQLTSLRKAALKPHADRYLAALDALAPIVARSGSTIVAAAVGREREAVLNASELPAKPGAEVPAQLFAARREYVSAAQRAAQAFAPRIQAQRAQFARQLAAIEADAKSRKDDALLVRLAEERARLAAEAAGNAPAGPGKNLLRNGDFTGNPPGPGKPPGWLIPEGSASIEMDNGNPFLHLLGRAECEPVPLPAGTKSIRVECRMRSPEFKALPLPGKHYACIRLFFEDAAGGHITHREMGDITDRQRAWKVASETIKVPPGAGRVRMTLVREGIDGALDADNLSLKAQAW